MTMQTLSAAPHSLRDAVARWWRNWRSSRAQMNELSRLAPDELQAIAHDVGVTQPELRALAAKPVELGRYLYRRLSALGLDPVEVGQREGAVLQDLQRVCTLCAGKRRCAHDLDQRPGDPRWQSYCPNAATLTALRTEAEIARGVRRSERRRQILGGY
jgi:hypothetical protein